MNEAITVDDVINTVIVFCGQRPPVKNLTLKPFGDLDLSLMIPGAGRGKLYAERNTYMGQPLRLSLVEEVSGGFEPFADFTKVHPPAQVSPGDVLVKTYGENEGLRPGLLASGFFEDTRRREPVGFTSLEVWRLTPAFVSAFAECNAAAIRATRAAIQRASCKAA